MGVTTNAPALMGNYMFFDVEACEYMYRCRTIVADFRHTFTVINMNDTPVSIGLIHSYV